MEIPFVLYADTESLFEKTQKCENNLENSFAAKVVVKHTACGFSILTYFSFDNRKDKYDYYRG